MKVTFTLADKKVDPSLVAVFTQVSMRAAKKKKSGCEKCALNT